MKKMRFSRAFWAALIGVALTGIATFAFADATTSKAGASADRKIKYYRNPMGLPDTSPAPKKDSMGMDYIPVY
ncbi:MAG: efflux transporter periplasmic adaptor subunit, partial [Bradyrhizobium sp.]